MTLDLLDGLSSTLLADAGASVLPCSIKPLKPGWFVRGKAFTVQVPPGDNLAVHAGLSLIQPGEVLVVQAQGLMERAIMGDIMCTQATALQVAGVIIHGAIRDSADLRQGSLPVFACGMVPTGPTKTGPGKVMHPITLGDAQVNPGDYIFGDDDGVVAFAVKDADRIIAAVHEKRKTETARLKAIKEGNLTPRWLAETLERHPIDIAPVLETRH